MPISKEQALQIIQRLSQGESLEALTKRLAPVPESECPLPPEVPSPRDATAEGRSLRLEFLRARGVETPHLAGSADMSDPATLAGNIEQYVGMTRVPTGLIGPLRVNGLHAHSDFYVPIATTEGALVASPARAAACLARRDGGACRLRQHGGRAHRGDRRERDGEGARGARDQRWSLRRRCGATHAPRGERAVLCVETARGTLSRQRRESLVRSRGALAGG